MHDELCSTLLSFLLDNYNKEVRQPVWLADFLCFMRRIHSSGRYHEIIEVSEEANELIHVKIITDCK